jgi:DNA-binding IclR family transcriptional regulator
MTRTDARSGLGSMKSGLAALEHLTEVVDCGPSELARALKTTKGTAHRLLMTLLVAGYVEQNPDTRRYRLSEKLLVLAGRLRERTSVQEVLRARLTELSRRTGEAVNLGVVDGDVIVYAHRVQHPSLAFVVDIKPGHRAPLYCTALGKAILAFTTKTEVARYLRSTTLEALTSTTITDPDRLREELAVIRERGYAFDDGEVVADVCCVAFPLLASTGRPLAAIGVSALRSRFEQKRERIVSEALAYAESLTAFLRPLGDPEISM